MPLRRTTFFRWLGLAALAVALPLAAQGTAPLSRAEERAIRAVVDNQLKAFLADDGRKAFSYAAPELQQAFETPANFMDMVRRRYPALYRHQSLAFPAPERGDNGVLQRLYLTDREGASWVATYILQQQADKSWRIAACGLARSAGAAT